MLMTKKHYCHNCNKRVKTYVKKEEKSYSVLGVTTIIKAKVNYCSICDEQVWNQKLEEKVLKNTIRKSKKTKE